MDEELRELADGVADQVLGFLLGVRAVARGDDPDISLAILLIEGAQLSLAGARLGALDDLVLEEPFEPEPGPDPDLDRIRSGLADLLGEVDAFVEVVDPFDPERGATGFTISAELTAVTADLLHGWRHYEAGDVLEAMWWWQYSYLASWGSVLGAVNRSLHSLVAHTRLDLAQPDIGTADAAS